jgi:hypothetical protein
MHIAWLRCDWVHLGGAAGDKRSTENGKRMPEIKNAAEKPPRQEEPNYRPGNRVANGERKVKKS